MRRRPLLLASPFLATSVSRTTDDDHYDRSDAGESDGSRPVEGGSPQNDASAEDEPECTSDNDCEAASYCELDTSRCVTALECGDETDCEAGFNCDETQQLCLPTDAERCSELDDEATCASRDDCSPTYAGVSCSCGPECTCMGGEPDCVCEDFVFFRCVEVPANAAG